LDTFNDKKWEAMSKSEQNVFLDECFEYDDELQKNDHLVAGGETLQRRPERRHPAMERRQVIRH
jgi:hypothetical protein